VYLADSWAIGRGYEWGKMTALVLYGMIPLIIAFVLVRKQLVRGLTFGALK
jgi:ABC-type glycerol-3-phosphate transport system permease component